MWQRIFTALTQDADNKCEVIDSTIVLAHSHNTAQGKKDLNPKRDSSKRLPCAASGQFAGLFKDVANVETVYRFQRAANRKGCGTPLCAMMLRPSSHDARIVRWLASK